MVSADRYDVEIAKWNEKGESYLKDNKQWQVSYSYESVFGHFTTLRPVYNFFKADLNSNTIALDYGCGAGWTTRLLAQNVKHLKAIDISEGVIKVLKKYCLENGITNIEATVGNGITLPYEDGEFDIVFGNAVLHHIELDKCLPELSRVLKPGGKAAFCEPFAENPLINSARFIKHHFFEKYVGTDKPLKYADLSIFKRYFPKAQFVETSFFRNRFQSLISFDRFVSSIPFLKRYVSYIAILLEK
jgi:ubiquinone/menaquinone biosynthesis C-methylase UbiE